jgi:hypothetical protein
MTKCIKLDKQVQSRRETPGIWSADTPLSYTQGSYRVIWGIQRWTAWETGVRRIGDASTAREAMKLCA